MQQGDVSGVFQLEGSNALRDLVVKIKPNSIGDLSHICAIFRPGPLASDGLPKFLSVRAGLEKPEYLIPQLEPILRNTSGFLIYQEQMIRIAKELCGYSLSEADTLRKNCGKKLTAEMEKEEAHFVKGWCQNGYPKEKGEELWSLILAFSDYSFNLAHSAAYGTISYITAWLKAHYPIEYMTSILEVERDNTDKSIRYLSESKRLGINVAPPDINVSGKYYEINGNNSIVFGLGPIKNIGEGPLTEILKARNEGPFLSFQDFVCRVDTGKVNKLKVESLIRAGAFDSFGENRATLLGYLENFWKYKDEIKSHKSKMLTYEKKLKECEQRIIDIDSGNLKNSKGKSLKPLKFPELPIAPVLPAIELLPELPKEEILQDEHELLGYYVSGHPMEDYREALRKQGLLNIEEVKQLEESGNITIAGVITEKKQITTSKKKLMGYVQLEDQTGRIEVVIFPKTFEKYINLFQVGKIVKITGTLEVVQNEEDFTYKIISNKFDELKPIKLSQEIIQVKFSKENATAVIGLLEKYKGKETKIKLIFEGEDGASYIFNRLYTIDNKLNFQTELRRKI